MKEAITNISKDQTYQLQLLLAFYHLDQHTASKAEKYYRELRKINHSHYHHLTIQHLMKTSIVIAEQAQPLSTLQGQKAEPLCLALNQMLSERASVKALVQGINMYLIVSSKPNEHSLKEGLSALAEKLSFGLNYIYKFEKAIQYFDFAVVNYPQSAANGSQYIQLFKSFTWLLFLVMRQRIPIRHLYEADYLLISVLYLMVRYVFDYLRPSSAQRVGTNKDIVSTILNQLFQIFEIDHPAVFKAITAQVDDIFQQLIQNQTLRYHQAYDFLSPTLIRVNYKRIDSLYTRRLNPHQIDYRLLLQHRSSTLTPAKHRKQTHYIDNRSKLEHKRKSFASHKILTFDGQEIDNPIQKCIQHSQIRLPQNVRVSPSFNRTPLICARQPSPNTSLVQIFMAKAIKYNELALQVPDNEEEVLSVITKILKHNYATSGLKDKVLLTYKYYLVLSSQCFNSQEWDQTDYNGIHCSCLTLALLFTLSSSSQASNLSESVRECLESIRRDIAVSPYQIWVACMYVGTDPQKPPMISKILECLEQLIVSELVWQYDSWQQIVDHMRGQQQNRDIRYRNLAVFVDNINLTIKGLIEGLVQSLNMEGDKHELSTNILQTLKEVLMQDGQIFENKSIHQLVLVATYLICREKHLTIRFNDIIQHYQIAHHLDSHTLKRIVTQVYEEDKTYLNIIDFYNLKFLPKVKLLRKQHHQPTLPHHSHLPQQRQDASWQPNHPTNSIQNMISKIQASPARHSISPLPSSGYHKQIAPKAPEALEGEHARDQTRIRARPAGYLQEQLQTEKAKSPRVE